MYLPEVFNTKEIKLRQIKKTRLRPDLSHLRVQKYKQSVQVLGILFVVVALMEKVSSHYFLHCRLFPAERSTLLNNLKEIDRTILNKGDLVVTHIKLYGEESFKEKVNLLILNASTDFAFSCPM